MLGNHVKHISINLKGLKSYKYASDHSEMKVQIYNRRQFGKFTNILKLYNTLFNSEWVKEVTGEITKYFELNENENPTYQIFWNAMKTMPRRKCMALNIYIKKRKISI